MFDTLRTALAFAVDIGVLIFIHELGHYLAARSQGVAVEVFSLGFGPGVLKYKAKSGTIWQLSALPLGGYVKMQGWGETDAKAPALPGSFSKASLSSKAVIVAAGPLANLALAVVLYAGLFMASGYPTTPAVFSKVVPQSPAAQAQLQPGDRVLAVGGTPVHNFTQLQQIVVAHPNADMDFTIRRDGRSFTDWVQIGAVKQGDKRIGHLGVAATPVYSRLAPLPAIAAAFHQTGAIIAGWGHGMGQLIVSHKGLSQLSGPIGIAQVTGKVAAMGIASLVTLVAFLSINLGLVNLIPIPILDGGHLLFYAWEGLTRRQIPERAREMALMFGGTFILMLFVLTTFNDLTRIGAVSWITHLL